MIRMKNLKTKAAALAAVLLVLLPAGAALPISLVRVGFIDVDRVLTTYTRNYLDTMLDIQESYLSRLEKEYNDSYYTLDYRRRYDMENQLRDLREEVKNLRLNRRVFISSGEIRSDEIFEVVQRNIMDAVKKTSELEGFSLILDKSGNFVYGSEEINLTDKVLFRLDERLLEMRERQLSEENLSDRFLLPEDSDDASEPDAAGEDID